MNDIRREPASELPWEIRFGSKSALKDWNSAFRQAPEIMQRELERLHNRPIDRSANAQRTAPLKFQQSRVSMRGKVLPQWQHELTRAGRIWYCVDKDEHIIWITKVTLRHPKETE